MTARKIIFDQSGSTAAEFGLVLPLLLLLLFGIIDVGRWMWTYNQAEKATQMGARLAVVAAGISGSATASPPTGLYASYVGTGGLIQGDVVPASAFGKITCTGAGSGASITASCTCTGPCPTGATTANATAFKNIFDRMHMFLPQLTASNVTIEYSSSGLGYAGSPVLPDLSPLVTVKVTGMTFKPLTILALTSMSMPNFTSTLSAEDISGAVSN